MPSAYNSALANPSAIRPASREFLVASWSTRRRMFAAGSLDGEPATGAVLGDRIAKHRMQDPIRRQHGAPQRAPDLRLAGQARPVAHRKLDDARVPASGFDDHFDRPAIRPLAHLEGL